MLYTAEPSRIHVPAPCPASSHLPFEAQLVAGTGVIHRLRSIGAAEVLEQFLQAELDMAVLPYLTDYDLEVGDLQQSIQPCTIS
jgi:hypothetical protein